MNSLASQETFDGYTKAMEKRWTVDDLRSQVRAGHPVIVQVYMRALPGRQNWPTATDHYLIITGLVGFTLAAYLTLLRSQNTSTMRSQAWNSTVPVVEAGVEDALTHLNNHGTTNLNCDGWTQSGTIYYKQWAVGGNMYFVTISNFIAGATNNFPVVESRGYVDLPIMAEAAQKILKESLDAFVNSDAELAEKVIFNDNVVDDMYEQIFRELLTYMLEDPRAISRAIKLIFIAKHLERVGDHSANIAEMVIFLVRGQDIRHGTRLDRGR